MLARARLTHRGLINDGAAQVGAAGGESYHGSPLAGETGRELSRDIFCLLVALGT
jgi:hypothetical protein